MPELPELEIYARRLRSLLTGRVIRDIRIPQPFVLRSVDPPIDELIGATVRDANRLGKRLAIRFGKHGESDVLELAIHLMRSGRLHWVNGKALHKSQGCAELRFDEGWSLQMTEASKRKQASIHLAKGGTAHEPIGIDPLSAGFTVTALAERLRLRSRQIKGALVDQNLLTGIGNAYSDEILFAADMSPLQLTGRLDDGDVAKLHTCLTDVLQRWISRIDALTPDRLPTDQPTWRREFAVHGRFGKPCPRCGSSVARISFAESETNYCPKCQTGGKLLADRRMSRLFRR